MDDVILEEVKFLRAKNEEITRDRDQLLLAKFKLEADLEDMRASYTSLKERDRLLYQVRVGYEERLRDLENEVGRLRMKINRSLE